MGRCREDEVSMLRELATSHGYHVPDGKFVVRVPKPFPAQRFVYYDLKHPTQAAAIPSGPDAMTFRQKEGEISNWSMTFGGGGFDLRGVLNMVAEVKPQFIECDDQLLKMRLPGDWVVDSSASDVQVAKALERILREDFKTLVRMEYRELERDVWVASGKFKRKQLDRDEPIRDSIHVFGIDFSPTGAGGSGSVKEYLNWLGRWLDEAIVSDATDFPQESVRWTLHEKPRNLTPVERQAHIEEVLKNATKQTSMTFKKQRRPVRMLVIENIADLRKPATKDDG